MQPPTASRMMVQHIIGESRQAIHQAGAVIQAHGRL